MQADIGRCSAEHAGSYAIIGDMTITGNREVLKGYLLLFVVMILPIFPVIYTQKKRD